MGYRKMTVDNLFELYRRWHDNQKPSEISRLTGLHRSTVYEYIKKFEGCDFSNITDNTAIRSILFTLVPGNEKSAPCRDLLENYYDEIKDYITRKEHQLKPKTAYQVITQKYELAHLASYSSFKRFIRKHQIASSTRSKQTLRIEVEPGSEVQIDYGKVGMKEVPFSSKRQAVHAFIAILAYSRLPFIQFVFTQTKGSFVASIKDMFQFYEGVVLRVNLDNLKAGVLKADIFDPELNRSFADMAAHYGFFIDPCRVAMPTDKGKVERFVPVARELYKRLITLYPSENLTQLNARALQWCRDEYGSAVHGTTGKRPIEQFHFVEKPVLRPLPTTGFEVSEWGSAKVHPDQYIRFKNKFYSLPAKYIGQTVQVRKTHQIIDILFEEKIIRTYTIPQEHRAYLMQDFPKETAASINGGYPAYLISRARKEFGPEVEAYLTQVLSVPANLTVRRALGLLDAMKPHKDQPYFLKVIAEAMITHLDQPRILSKKLIKASQKAPVLLITPKSLTGKQMVHDINYYLN